MSGDSHTLPVEEPPAAPGSSRTVLIVDDDNGVLAMTQAILSATGFESVTASSGEAAVEIYSRLKEAGREVDLVLLDLTLPGGMDGLETVQTLRGLDPGARVIAVSGYFDESAAASARMHGFIGILPKPYTAERLAKVVNWGVGKAAA